MSALEGIRVLDFGRYVAGPLCATLLADFGADVIRIDRIGGSEDRKVVPVGEDGEGALFLQVNRNKRSITLDTRTEEGREIQGKLIATADVVVNNVPDFALIKLGLDLASLHAVKSDIVLTNVSSFGPRGPWAARPGFDSIGQAMSGSAYLSGPGDVPYRSPITWVDHLSAVYAALGTMIALQERSSSGRGQQVDGSLLGSAMAASSTFLIEQAMLGLDRTAIGNRSFVNGPTDTFRTTDGFIVTQVVGDALFRRWAKLMGEPDWIEDPRFANDELRGQNGEALSERMAAWCTQRSSQQALDELDEAGIPAGPVLSPQQAVDHEQVAGMDFLQPTSVGTGSEQTAPLMRAPLDLSETPASIRTAPPRAGEHNAEVLGELGYSAQDIARLKEAGAI